jgi:hypothetical protein
MVEIIYVGFFLVNDKNDVNVKCPQTWDLFLVTLMQSFL